MRVRHVVEKYNLLRAVRKDSLELVAKSRCVQPPPRQNMEDWQAGGGAEAGVSEVYDAVRINVLRRYLIDATAAAGRVTQDVHSLPYALLQTQRNLHRIW